jgi:hypothetical protein
MANWYGTARSNYFAVKDEAAFRAWAGKRGLQVWEEKEEKPAEGKEPRKLFGVAPDGFANDSGGWPSVDFEADDDHAEIDLVAELAELIQDDQIVVLEQVGSEKLRYINGHATAFNSAGKRIDVDLDDIYRIAAKRFKVPEASISLCSY